MLKLLVSWRESLTLFIPKNAKLFFLVVLKTLISTYKHLLKYGWPVFLIALISSSYLLFIPMRLFLLSYVSPLWITFLWVFWIILAVRPSTKLKSWRYFSEYLWHGLFLLATAFFVSLAMQLLIMIAFNLASAQSVVSAYAITIGLYPIVFSLLFSFDIYLWSISPWFLLSSFFVLDSGPSFKRFLTSLWRAFLMVIYNYPFCFIVYVIFRYVLNTLGYFLHSVGLPLILSNGIMLILLPIPITIFACFYTKRLHDQFGYYFPRAKT